MNNNTETLSYEEFEERLWNYLPEELISVSDIENNRDWADSLVHDAWRIHRYSGTPYPVVMKLVEQIVLGFKVHRPMLFIKN